MPWVGREKHCVMSKRQVVVIVKGMSDLPDLQARMAAEEEDLRNQIRIEVMQEIVEDPEFSW